MLDEGGKFAWKAPDRTARTRETETAKADSQQLREVLARLELLENVVSENQEWRQLASTQGDELRELRRRSRSLADKLSDIESTLPVTEPS